jgi:hypothetical protein
MRRTAPEFERMNSEEFKMNRKMLKKVKAEVADLKTVYQQTALPTITNVTY